ncbi:energy-coupled thiamine transporter ThiT [Dethiosulfovibrio salsuginis]|uniref:Thiamine transporter n=1 Tax=Dethiosulfovibrio salsuginis TaxID=561720 RepID=A0A1X7K329_9BACT|nr:energy-coupled thiamine transporter ThiT [Dethiosulfovibrio salsuginis]SMG35210.1 thiamine transporter [Dethiosulfovibrio salsuginis]
MKGNTRILVEASLSVALAVTLSYVKLFRMPQGGSITLENVPLLLFSLRYGLKAGFGAGAVAGLLQLMLGGYVAHPIQAVLDYPLAFAALGLAGSFRHHHWAGIALGTVARLACHVASGVVFFASYAPVGQNPLVYSLVYNGSYMVPNMILSIVMITALWKRLPKPVTL